MKNSIFRLLFVICFIFAVTVIFVSYADQATRVPVEPQKHNIVVYSALPVEYTAVIAQEFEKKTGIIVQCVTLPNDAIAARLIEERESPRADIWLGGVSEYLYSVRREALLAPYQSQATDKIPAAFKDVDGYWTGVFIDVYGFASSRDLRSGVKMPNSWEDIVESKDMRVVMPDPTMSAEAATPVVFINSQKQRQEAISYLKRLHQHVIQYTKSSNAPVRATLMGEADIAVLPVREAIRYMQEGFPLSLSFPKEGTGFQLVAAAVVRGAQNGSDAGLFLDWLTSKEAQELAYKTNLFYYGTNPDVITPNVMPRLSKLKLINYDRKWESLYRSKLIDEWIQKVRIG